MKHILIIVGVVATIVAGVCMFSPTAKYAVKGQITKIENAAQLENAIEILEAKNIEMQEKYVNLAVGIHAAEAQIKMMRSRADAVAAKPQTELNVAKHAMYTDGVEKLTTAYNKLITVREGMRTNIVKHKSNIELLRTRLTYLESLKTMNSYMKDIGIDTEFGNGINALVEAAIANEEAVSEALSDMSVIRAEMSDM